MSQDKITHNEVFSYRTSDIRQITIVANGGTAALYAIAGDGTAIAVPNGMVGEDAVITFIAAEGQPFKMSFTGNAEGWKTE